MAASSGPASVAGGRRRRPAGARCRHRRRLRRRRTAGRAAVGAAASVVGRLAGRVVVGHDVRDLDRLDGVDRGGGVAEVQHDPRRQVADRARAALLSGAASGGNGTWSRIVPSGSCDSTGAERLEVDRDDQPLDGARGLVAVGLVRRLRAACTVMPSAASAAVGSSGRPGIGPGCPAATKPSGPMAEGLAGDGHGAVVGAALGRAGRAVAGRDDGRGDAGHRHDAAEQPDVAERGPRGRGDLRSRPRPTGCRRRSRRRRPARPARRGAGRPSRRRPRSAASLGVAASTRESCGPGRPSRGRGRGTPRRSVEVVGSGNAGEPREHAAAAAAAGVAGVVAGAVAGVAVAGEADGGAGGRRRPTAVVIDVPGNGVVAARLVVPDGYCELTWTG